MNYRMQEAINRKEFWFMLISLGIVLAVGAISAQFELGWKSAWALSIGMYSTIWIFAWLTRDTFLQKILLFGIAAGITELAADCWLVHSTQTLVYAPDEPMLACSPVYMPFSWAVILTQVGYLGWLIAHKETRVVTTIVTALIGGMVIPLFEHWANDAGWWYYHHTKMIGNTPYYIAAAEILLCSVLPLAFIQLFKQSKWVALLLGIGEGLVIWISYFIFFNIFH
jgi:hypothetical protein